MPVINFWAVLVAGAVAMILGFLWYGPIFGKLWMQGQGWDTKDKALMEKMQKSAGPAYLQMFIGALLMAFVFAHVLWAFRVATASMPMTPLAAGLQGAFWMWLGFVLPVKYGDKLWNGKSFGTVAIDLGYYLVLLLINGLILSYWL